MFDDRWVYLHPSPTGGPTFRVWRSPSSAQGAVAFPLGGTARGILTAEDLFIWRALIATHAMFVRLTGIDGLRFRLADGAIGVHQETIALPDHFSFVYGDVEAAGEQDPETRRSAVERWLRSNAPLRTIHPGEFTVYWYM